MKSSFSRKYRPQKISDVIGQDFAVKTIKNAFELDKLAHAFLLTGIRGVGKTTIARIIAMGLNCVSFKNPSLILVINAITAKKLLRIDLMKF